MNSKGLLPTPIAIKSMLYDLCPHPPTDFRCPIGAKIVNDNDFISKTHAAQAVSNIFFFIFCKDQYG